MISIALYMLIVYAFGWPEAFGKKIARIHKAYKHVMTGLPAKENKVK